MDRREYLATLGGIGLGAFAGCTESSDDGNGDGSTIGAPDTQEPTSGSTTGAPNTEEQPTESPTEEPATEQPTEESTTEQSSSSQSSYQVRIKYNGEWSGSVGSDGSTRSVDGAGTRTFDVQGDPLIVSANAQKQDGGSDTLTVQILKNGEVIAEQSTSAEYGVAQVTSEGGIDSGDSGSTSAAGASFSVRIQYDGSWQGAVGTGGSTRTVEGSGNRTIELEGSPDIISANAQKQDDSSDELTIQILKDGEVVKETSTSAAYGVAQVTYSNF